MQYKEYKNGIKLSRLGMGAMRLPVLNQDEAQIDYNQAEVLIDQCMKGGVNYYDTAFIYHEGKSEEFLGRALAKYPRDTFYVADKFNYQANPDYRAQFQEQRKRLQMERIDFYLLHGIQDHFADDITGSGCIEYFDQMKHEGKIRYLGFSFHGSADVLSRILDMYPWDFVQIQLNYYDWYYGDAKELYEILTRAGIPVIVMEPVHGGMLADLTEKAAEELRGEASQASWAMRWVMGLENVQVVLSGMSDDVQVKDNLKTFSEYQALTEENHNKIEKAAEIQYSTVAVACTGCRYCCPDCPQGLDIPFLLNVYNEAKIGDAWRLNKLNGLSEDKKPSACQDCGTCSGHCPQGFDIPGYMKEMQKIMKEL